MTTPNSSPEIQPTPKPQGAAVGLVSDALFGAWAPIATAPQDGTKFLAWMRESWIEVMYYDEGNIYYGSDGDSPPHGRSLPQYWMPLPSSPNTQMSHAEERE